MKTSRQAAIGFIFVTLLIDTIGFGIIIPVLPNLIMEMTHGTTTEAARIALTGAPLPHAGLYHLRVAASGWVGSVRLVVE